MAPAVTTSLAATFMLLAVAVQHVAPGVAASRPYPSFIPGEVRLAGYVQHPPLAAASDAPLLGGVALASRLCVSVVLVTRLLLVMCRCKASARRLR